MHLLRLSDDLRQRLHCPVCKAGLDVTVDGAVCVAAGCGRQFSIVDGVPILINESNSIFSLDDFQQRRSTTFKLHRSRLESMLDGMLNLLPDLSKSIGTERNYASFRDL